MKTPIKINSIKHYFLDPEYLKPYLLMFSEYLADKGFTALTIRTYFDSVAHFATWLYQKDIKINEINYEVENDFANHFCNCPGSRHKHILSRRYVKRTNIFVDYLYQNNIIHTETTISKTEEPSQLTLFFEHLSQCGLKPITVAGYKRYITILLSALGDDPHRYDASLVRKVIFEIVQKRSCSESIKFVSILRRYLRFLVMEGLCSPYLDEAVPTIAQWKLSSMPRYITSSDVERIIDSCDIYTHQGRRDRAIILLLARLGLRAGDVINLRIDDINWADGTLTVTGKSRREERLPLPQDVGDALLMYLERTRQPVQLEQLFLCLNAPYRTFSKSSSIADIVRAAILRAKIKNPPSYGAHLLRHSMATALIRSGATLETVATVLRHRSLDTTAYYAKVDIPSLMKIAQPWMGATSC